MPITTPAPTDTGVRSLAPGLRLRPRPVVAPVALAVVAAGFVLAIVAVGDSTAALVSVAAPLAIVAATLYRPAIGIALVALAYPLELGTGVGPVPGNGILIGALGAGWVAQRFVLKTLAWRRTRLDLPVALFAAATLLSLAGFGGYFSEQVGGLVTAFMGFALFLIVAQTLRGSRETFVVIAAVLVSVLVQIVAAALAVLSGSQAISEQTRLTGTLGDPNHFAGSLLLLLPLTIALATASSRRWMLVPAALAAIASAVTLVATLSRGAWLGLLVAVAVLLWLLPGRRLRIGLLAGAAVAAVVIAGLSGPIAARLSPHATGPVEMLNSRWRVWTAATAMTIQHPVFGVGVGNFRHYYPAYGIRPANVDHAHNLWLNIAAERGIPAMAAFMVVLIALLNTLGAGLRGADDPWRRALAAGMIAGFAGYLVHSMFDVSYYDARVMLLFWLLAGVAAGLPLLTPVKRPPE
jgi:putative inorganic carbon (hco3(-)) transporter